MKDLTLTIEQKKALGIIDERKDFYFKVENAVVDEDIFSSIYEFTLFIILSRYCNNGNIAYPSLNTLAKKCFCSRPTLLKAIKGLEEKGLIKKINRYDESTKTFSSNVYSIQNLKEYKVIDKKTNNSYTKINSSELQNKKKKDYEGSKGDLLGVVNEVYQGSKGDLLGVVNEVYQGSKRGLHNKELLEEELLSKKTTTINTKKQKTENNNNNSSSSNFLKKFNISNITKKNIQKHFPNLKEEEFTEVYNKAKKYAEQNECNFEAVLFLGLKKEWNFIETTEEEKELSQEKQKWVNYFHFPDEQFKKDVENLVKQIDIETLEYNKKKLGRLPYFDFKVQLRNLARQQKMKNL